MKWIYPLHSPISLGLCFVLPLVASHGCCQHWYSIQCYHPQIYQVVFAIRKRAVGRTAKRMLLITSFAVLALFETKSTGKKTPSIKLLHNSSVNNIPFKIAGKFCCPYLVPCYPLRQTCVKLRIFS